VDNFRVTEERTRAVELLNWMEADSHLPELLRRQAGCGRQRVERQADLTQYVVQQRSLVSQDWRLEDEQAA
jgi:hypothetical protein